MINCPWNTSLEPCPLNRNILYCLTTSLRKQPSFFSLLAARDDSRRGAWRDGYFRRPTNNFTQEPITSGLLPYEITCDRLGHFWVPKLSLSKWGLVQNLTSFICMKIKKIHFHINETEAKGYSEMANKETQIRGGTSAYERRGDARRKFWINS